MHVNECREGRFKFVASIYTVDEHLPLALKAQNSQIDFLDISYPSCVKTNFLKEKF